MKHTPGPWEVVELKEIGGRYIKAGDLKIDARPNNDEVSMTDARLIAAAPEMLQELRFMVITCCGSVEDPKSPNCTKCLNARLLIAKIEGGK